MRDDERPLCFIQFVQGFPHLLFFLLFQQAVFRRFFFRRSPIIGEIGDDIRFDDVFLDAFQITLFPVAFIFKCILKVFSANDKEIGTAAWWHKPLCNCPCFSKLPTRQLMVGRICPCSKQFSKLPTRQLIVVLCTNSLILFRLATGYSYLTKILSVCQNTCFTRLDSNQHKIQSQ